MREIIFTVLFIGSFCVQYNEMGIFKNALALVYFWKRGI